MKATKPQLERLSEEIAELIMSPQMKVVLTSEPDGRLRVFTRDAHLIETITIDRQGLALSPQASRETS